MERLRSRDLRALLDLVGDVYALRDSDAFTTTSFPRSVASFRPSGARTRTWTFDGA
jgi:hypothetical protein